MDGETTRDKLVGDLKTLIGDAEELLKATTAQAGEKVTAARQKIEQSLIEGKKALADAEKVVIKKSKECAEIADDYVRENPVERGGYRGQRGFGSGFADSPQLILPDG